MLPVSMSPYWVGGGGRFTQEIFGNVNCETRHVEYIISGIFNFSWGGGGGCNPLNPPPGSTSGRAMAGIL